MDGAPRDLFDPERLREAWSRAAETAAGGAGAAPEVPQAPALELLARLRAAVARELGKAAAPLDPLFERARSLVEEQAGTGDPAEALEGKALEANAAALGLVLDDVEDLLEALRLGAPAAAEEQETDEEAEAAPHREKVVAPELPELPEIPEIPLPELPEAGSVELPEIDPGGLFRAS